MAKEIVPDSSLFISNYHIIHHDRNCHGGGETLTVYL